MSASKYHICILSAFVFALGSGSASENSPELHAFFPTQAVCIDEEKQESGMTVICENGDISVSLRLTEIIRDIMDKLGDK